MGDDSGAQPRVQSPSPPQVCGTFLSVPALCGVQRQRALGSPNSPKPAWGLACLLSPEFSEEGDLEEGGFLWQVGWAGRLLKPEEVTVTVPGKVRQVAEGWAASGAAGRGAGGGVLDFLERPCSRAHGKEPTFGREGGGTWGSGGTGPALADSYHER